MVAGTVVHAAIQDYYLLRGMVMLRRAFFLAGEQMEDTYLMIITSDADATRTTKHKTTIY
jgi:hypothetical protein